MIDKKYLLTGVLLFLLFASAVVITFFSISVYDNEDKSDKFSQQQSDLEMTHDPVKEYKMLVKNLVKEMDYRLSIKQTKPNETQMLYPQDIEPITTTVINHQCKNFGANLTVLIVVITRVDGFDRRSTIRQTWAKQLANRTSVKLMFATALTKNSSNTVQQRLEAEARQHDDILQFGFVDDYYNLTLKSLAILRWTLLQCPLTSFVFKVDDDVIINVDNLVEFCDSNYDASDSIYGLFTPKNPVHHWKGSKYYISESDYPAKTYPQQIAGPWLTPGSVVPALFTTAINLSLPALPFEDAFITGIVAKKAGVECKQLPGFVKSIKLLNDTECTFDENIIYLVDDEFSDQNLVDVWKRIENRKENCSVKVSKK